MGTQSLYERRGESHILNYKLPNQLPATMPSTEHFITINNERLPIVIRKHRQSRRMIIRYQPLQQAVGLTLPRYVSIKQGLHFIEEKRSWIERQMQEHAKPVLLEHGQIIPVLGRHYVLNYVGGRGVVHICGDNVNIPGEEVFAPRRIRQWLKEQVQQEITMIARQRAALLDVRYKRISLRDTTSRWGSCSHDGCLSFSWRLVFAPYEILDYVVSHEVAHLREHNHSDAFWALVQQLHPDYRHAERWLKDYGNQLYSYK